MKSPHRSNRPDFFSRLLARPRPPHKHAGRAKRFLKRIFAKNEFRRSEFLERLKWKPGPAFCLVDPVLDQTGCGNIVVPVANLVDRPQGPRHLLIVGHLFTSSERISG